MYSKYIQKLMNDFFNILLQNIISESWGWCHHQVLQDAHPLTD